MRKINKLESRIYALEQKHEAHSKLLVRFNTNSEATFNVAVALLDYFELTITDEGLIVKKGDK